MVEAFGGECCGAAFAVAVGEDVEGWGYVAFAELVPVFGADGVVDDEAVVLLGDLEVVEFYGDVFGMGVGGEADAGESEGSE